MAVCLAQNLQVTKSSVCEEYALKFCRMEVGIKILSRSNRFFSSLDRSFIEYNTSY